MNQIIWMLILYKVIEIIYSWIKYNAMYQENNLESWGMFLGEPKTSTLRIQIYDNNIYMFYLFL